MNHLSLKEIQAMSLYVLKKVHNFCVDNQIHYSLAYCTLLGAVRHKGFIPWDDDIDIMMPRPDYERFCSSFRMEGLSLYCQKNNPDCLIAYARVCDDVYTKSSSNSWLIGGGKTGIWIDIFPIDSVEDDETEYLKRYHKAQRYYNQLFRYRAYLFEHLKENSLKLNILISFLRIWPFSYFMKQKARSFLKEFILLGTSTSYGSTSHVSQLAIPGTGSRNYLNINSYGSYQLADFEDTQLYVVKEYDYILQNNFGDYMQLPPESERVPGHTQAFYWKDPKQTPISSKE